MAPRTDPVPVPGADESDEVAIARAMNRAEGRKSAGDRIVWENRATEARGTITRMTAGTRGDGTVCRRFTATRARFDGVSIYHGQACREGGGAWRVRTLESL